MFIKTPQLEHFQRSDGHETLPIESLQYSTKDKQLQLFFDKKLKVQGMKNLRKEVNYNSANIALFWAADHFSVFLSFRWNEETQWSETKWQITPIIRETGLFTFLPS